MENSKIEWTHHTFNPWRGCTKISPGCTNCYAETLSHRNPKTLGVWGDKGTRVIAADAAWKEPIKWDRAAKAVGQSHRVFCASLADVFEDRPELDEPRQRLFSLIERCNGLNWLLLTKRPENVVPLLKRCVANVNSEYCAGAVFAERWLNAFAPPNVWLGVSVEDQQRADERIPLLLKTPAAVRFLSVEPMLGPVNLSERTFLNRVESIFGTAERVDWVIIGGESGPGARPFQLAWARSIRDQCQAAGVACFIKQLGRAPSDGEPANLHQIGLQDRKGGDWNEWPEDLRVREFPATV